MDTDLLTGSQTFVAQGHRTSLPSGGLADTPVKA